MMLYMVRKREVLTGFESWVVGEDGQPVSFEDRLGADLLTLICNKKLPEWNYAYVLPVDPSCEEVIA